MKVQLLLRWDRRFVLAGLAALVLSGSWVALKRVDAGPAPSPRAMVGAYYFDGWAGRHRLAETEVWAQKAPTGAASLKSRVPGRLCAHRLPPIPGSPE